jgi:hypothetical protein
LCTFFVTRSALKRQNFGLEKWTAAAPAFARTEPALSDAALNALEDIDQPRANAIATAVRNGSDRMRRGHGAATLDPPQMIGALVIGVPYQLLTLGSRTAGP